MRIILIPSGNVSLFCYVEIVDRSEFISFIDPEHGGIALFIGFAHDPHFLIPVEIIPGDAVVVFKEFCQFSGGYLKFIEIMPCRITVIEPYIENIRILLAHH